MPYPLSLLPGLEKLVTALRLLSADHGIRGGCRLFRKHFGAHSVPKYLKVHGPRYLPILSGEYP